MRSQAGCTQPWQPDASLHPGQLRRRQDVERLGAHVPAGLRERGVARGRGHGPQGQPLRAPAQPQRQCAHAAVSKIRLLRTASTACPSEKQGTAPGWRPRWGQPRPSRAGISGEMMKDNDNLLRNMFFTILRHHQPKLATKLDVVYALSSAWSLSESDADFEMLEKRLNDLSPDELIMVPARGCAPSCLVSEALPPAGVAGGRTSTHSMLEPPCRGCARASNACAGADLQRLLPAAQPAQPVRGDQPGTARARCAHGRGRPPKAWPHGCCEPGAPAQWQACRLAQARTACKVSRGGLPCWRLPAAEPLGWRAGRAEHAQHQQELQEADRLPRHHAQPDLQDHLRADGGPGLHRPPHPGEVVSEASASCCQTHLMHLALPRCLWMRR